MIQFATVMPIGLTPQEWADQLRVDWSTDNIPQWMPGTSWQQWAASVVAQNTALRGGAPNPYQFATFEDWALRVFQVTN